MSCDKLQKTLFLVRVLDLANEKSYYMEWCKRYFVEGTHCCVTSPHQKTFLYNSLLSFTHQESTHYLKAHRELFKFSKTALFKNDYINILNSKIYELGILLFFLMNGLLIFFLFFYFIIIFFGQKKKRRG